MSITRYAEAYELGPLAPDSSYEAKVAAKNAYGWSEQSDIFIFYTQGKGTLHINPLMEGETPYRPETDSLCL